MQSSRNIIGSIMQTTLLCSHGTSNGHCYATGCGHAMRLCKHTRQRRDIMHPATSIASTGASNAINRCSIMQSQASYGQQDINATREDFMTKKISTLPSRALHGSRGTMPRPNASSRTGKPVLQHSHGRYASHLCAGRKQNSMHRRNVRETK